MKLIYIGCLMALFFSCMTQSQVNNTHNDIITTLNKNEQNQWHVTYTSTKAVKRIAFARNPDHSRLQRWQATNKNIKLTVIDGHEYIVDMNGDTFKSASFLLTPTYASLPKDYSPFSPFSDGSMLIHTGRFFVCPDYCHNSIPHTVRITTDAKETIIANKKNVKGSIEFLDKGDGQKVYVGRLELLESDDVFAVIDPNLPESLLESLKTTIPLMLKTYRNKLEALPSKPTLFASYSDHQGEYGHQGGTLPDQIFMHWYGKNSLKDIRNEEIDWFFSHEVAHLFQGNVSRTEKTKHHWIHEGAAEYMAYLSLQKGTTTQSNYAKQHLNKNINSCLKDVSTNTVNAYIDMGYYPILYHCGLLLWQAIDHESKLRTQNSNVFTIWHEYRKLSERDGPGLDTLTKVIKPLVSEKTMFATFNLLTITHDELESIRVVTK